MIQIRKASDAESFRVNSGTRLRVDSHLSPLTIANFVCTLKTSPVTTEIVSIIHKSCFDAPPFLIAL